MQPPPIIERTVLFGNPTRFQGRLSPDGKHVLYIQDQGGDENWHLYSIELASGDITDLSPLEGVQA